MDNDTQRDALPQPSVDVEHPPATTGDAQQQPHTNEMTQNQNEPPTTQHKTADTKADHASHLPYDTMTVDSAIGADSPVPMELKSNTEEAIRITESPALDIVNTTMDESLPATTAAPTFDTATTTSASIPTATALADTSAQVVDRPVLTDTGAHHEVYSLSNKDENNTAAITETISPIQDGNITESKATIVDPLDQDVTTAQDEATCSDMTRKRPESLLTSPLTHPNGVRMFPSLTTSQQEDLAREALNQAQDSIIADSSAYSASAIADDMSDGGYESDGFSSASTSAESSVRDYMYENGRRYHAFREGHYNFPNDDVEQEREDMKHAMMKLLCSQKLHFAPIGDNPQQILDIGTGTGIWTIEMGDLFPSAQVLGVDLSPIQPDWLPPNVKFLVDDVESPWLHPRNHFDYIHSRHTVMAIKDWMRLFRRSLEHLKPGGWIELQEIHHKPRSAIPGGTVPPDHPAARFWDLVTEGLGKLGINLDGIAGGNLCKMMEDAGFINVTELVLHVPLGIWPKNKVLKTVGLYWRTILLDGLQAIALGPLTRGLQWKREEVEVFLTSARQGHHDNSALMYMPLHIIYAQKPLDMA